MSTTHSEFEADPNHIRHRDTGKIRTISVHVSLVSLWFQFHNEVDYKNPGGVR